MSTRSRRKGSARRSVTKNGLPPKGKPPILSELDSNQSRSPSLPPLQKEDYLELLKPREERDYSEYYEDLQEEEPLSLMIINHQDRLNPDPIKSDEISGYIEQLGDERLKEHRARQQRIDSQILSTLKRPSFRPIPLKSTALDNNNEYQPPLKLHKTYIQLGYNDPKHKKTYRQLPDTFIRSDSTKNGLIKNSLTYSDKFQVLYDMDEQDYLFLEQLNEERSTQNLNQLSLEVFEIIITFFEVQWYFVEKLLPPKPKNHYISDERAMIQASIYGSEDGTGAAPEEDQPCAVCNKTECDASNAIVFCDGCDIAVHQECYGVAFIPEGPWLCRRCLISRNQQQRCLFCPSTTGAFKQTDNGYWGHVICTLWINELYFANPVYMEPIEGIQSIPKGRWKLTCYICRKKIGACLQCRKNSCFVAYHATCARRADLYMELKNGVQGGLSDKTSAISYCDKHSPKSWNLTHNTKLGIEKTRLYYSLGNNKQLSSQKHKIKINRKLKDELKETKNELFKWKTSKGSPIAPQIFIDKLRHFLSSEKIQIQGSDDKVLQEMAKYWTLKRDYKKAPLIKRPDATNFGNLTDEEIKERFQVLNAIEADVSRLLEFSEPVLERSTLNTELNQTTIDSIEMFYFPMQWLISQVITKFLSNDSKNALKNTKVEQSGILSISEIVEKAEKYEYETVTELVSDIDDLSDHVLMSGVFDKTTSTYKHFKQYWKRVRGTRMDEFFELEKMIVDGEISDLYDLFDASGLNIKSKDEDGSDAEDEAVPAEVVNGVLKNEGNKQEDDEENGQENQEKNENGKTEQIPEQEESVQEPEITVETPDTEGIKGEARTASTSTIKRGLASIGKKKRRKRSKRWALK